MSLLKQLLTRMSGPPGNGNKPGTQFIYEETRTQTASIHNEQDEVFNYELVQLRYTEACEDYFRNTNRITGPWTQKVRTLVIHSIKAKKKTISWMDVTINLGLDKYQIVLDEGEEKLVLTGTSKEVLPYEECFDIFVELHLKTRHGGFEVIVKKLENTFSINNTCVNFFLSHCNTCKKFKLENITPVAFNDCVTIEILKAPIQDFECRFILFYMDSFTTNMFIRPLMAMDEYEISIEMLKIFTDFGPPQVIKTIHVPLLNNVLTILERGGFHYDISIQASEKIISESYSLMQQILSRNNEDHNFWSTICRFIQFKHNNGLLEKCDPMQNRVYPTKPHNTVFFNKFGTKKGSVSEKQTMSQNNDQDTGNNTVTLSSKGDSTKERVLSAESSETDTASETLGFQSSRPMKTENILHLNEDDSNETMDNAEIEDESVYNSSMYNEDDNEIKIEYNPLNPDSHSQTSVGEFPLPKIEEDNEDQSKPHCSLTVDSIPMEQDPFLDELDESSNVIGLVSAKESLPMSPDIDSGSSTQHEFSVGFLRKHPKKQEISDDMKMGNDFCSSCNGKMLTDFICFGCKKKTHLFCLTRVSSPLKKPSDTVISFTYCELCIKNKCHLTTAFNEVCT